MRILDPQLREWADENGISREIAFQAVASGDLPVWHDWRGRARINPAVGHAWLAGWRAGDRQGYGRGHNDGLREVSRRDHVTGFNKGHAIGFGRGHDEGHAYGLEEGIRLGHEAGYLEGQAGRLTVNIKNIQPVRMMPIPVFVRFH